MSDIRNQALDRVQRLGCRARMRGSEAGAVFWRLSKVKN
jgi:hypothetical protein